MEKKFEEIVLRMGFILGQFSVWLIEIGAIHKGLAAFGEEFARY